MRKFRWTKMQWKAREWGEHIGVEVMILRDAMDWTTLKTNRFEK